MIWISSRNRAVRNRSKLSLAFWQFSIELSYNLNTADFQGSKAFMKSLIPVICTVISVTSCSTVLLSNCLAILRLAERLQRVGISRFCDIIKMQQNERKCTWRISLFIFHTTYSWNIKWQKWAGMGLNGFIIKKKQIKIIMLKRKKTLGAV